MTLPYKVGQIDISTVATAFWIILNNFKRKQTEVFQHDDTTLSFHRPRRSAWFLASSTHGVSAHWGILIKGMSQTYSAYHRSEICQSYCLSHPRNNEMTTYPHKCIELSSQWISDFFLWFGPNRITWRPYMMKTSALVSLSSEFHRVSALNPA